MEKKDIKDILADVLKVGELGSRVVCRPKLPAPWGLVFDPKNQAMFHIIKKGSCLFYENKDADPITLLQGDLIFIPKRNYYQIKSSEEVEAVNLSEELSRLSKITDTKNKQMTNMICGAYELKSNMSLPFFSLLPKYFHLTSEQINSSAELSSIVQILRKEDSDKNIGGELIIARLLDILLILIVRVWLETSNDESIGWLLGTLDTEIGEVLSIIHERPQERITIESLAKETAMSRTKLLNKFTKLVGISPIQYLTNWRIDLSKQLLTSTDLSIFEISNSVGYESEASFGRVFKKIEKMPPGQYRKSFMA